MCFDPIDSFSNWCHSTYENHQNKVYTEKLRDVETNFGPKSDTQKIEELLHLSRIWMDQTSWIIDHHGNRIVSKVCRLESIHSDLPDIFTKIGLPFSLGMHNRLKPVDYRSFYDSHSIKQVASNFVRDIDSFQYQFGCPS